MPWSDQPFKTQHIFVKLVQGFLFCRLDLSNIVFLLPFRSKNGKLSAGTVLT